MASKTGKKSTYKVGIIGTGFGSVVHYPGFLDHPSFKPISIAGKHETKTKRIAKKLQIDDHTTNWKDLISNDEIDVLSVVTPPHLHHEISISALHAGKHVLCEKPLSTNLKNAIEMHSTAEESGLIAMIDLVFRYIPSRAFMIELIKNGYLGEIYQLDISVTNSSRLNPRLKGYNWWSDIKNGGGVLNALGSHYIDFLLMIFEDVTAVSGKTATHISKRLNKMTSRMKKTTADDAFTCLFDVGDNILSTLKISTTTAYGRGPRIEAYGDQGALIMREDQSLIGGQLGEDEALKPLTIPKRHKLSKVQGDKHFLIPAFTKLLDDLEKGIMTGKSLHPNFEDGMKIQRIIEAVRQSHSKNRWVKIEE